MFYATVLFQTVDVQRDIEYLSFTMINLSNFLTIDKILTNQMMTKITNENIYEKITYDVRK